MLEPLHLATYDNPYIVDTRWIQLDQVQFHKMYTFSSVDFVSLRFIKFYI